MSGFSADWLALREPLDAVSRSPVISAALTDWRQGFRDITVLDLGAGTGANLRFLAPRLGGEQTWLLLDHDPALLAATGSRTAAWARQRGFTFDQTAAELHGSGFRCRLRITAFELVADLERLDLAGGQLVTASALLDLVSARWLTSLIHRCRAAGVAVCWVLSYDGRRHWEPADADDGWIGELVNRHQRTDKGFGPALGPEAVAMAKAIFSNLGYTVITAASDWRIGPEQAVLQQRLLDDWARAAKVMAPAATDQIDGWQQRRRALLAAGQSRWQVGHQDFFARLAADHSG